MIVFLMVFWFSCWVLVGALVAHLGPKFFRQEVPPKCKEGPNQLTEQPGLSKGSEGHSLSSSVLHSLWEAPDMPNNNIPNNRKETPTTTSWGLFGALPATSRETPGPKIKLASRSRHHLFSHLPGTSRDLPGTPGPKNPQEVPNN